MSSYERKEVYEPEEVVC